MSWLKLLFSQSSEASFSRVATAFSVAASLFWVTHIVLRTHVLPSLDGLAFFNGSIYGLGKINETVQTLGK